MNGCWHCGFEHCYRDYETGDLRCMGCSRIQKKGNRQEMKARLSVARRNFWKSGLRLILVALVGAAMNDVINPYCLMVMLSLVLIEWFYRTRALRHLEKATSLT